ncbi:peptidyl-prolyl cis-trans isomerase CWC27 -like protein [Brachionus plicatilis]|uniref:Spliceosome-associated protein CWC27 homolog n=1 Tax=Brachionus plicatilis TaxID=10195 RepID=A0A3M7SUV0_BRAPC|nr:peptidyl-prolyl cis-trans isomerase CWC27 -like protein [Brachionus plicatilis]
MSNIYIQEPPTDGKVVLKTTIGDIEIELWSKEAPKACRNFVQLCMEGYYDKTIFHRVVKDFIAQGGDPTGTGHGGESIYGEPFKDEVHSRLRFNRRGLVAMANSQKNDNGSQFFFTLGPCYELQGKHTIFGKVGGQTIYNMIRLNESECDDEQPLRPEKIISTKVVYNPFDDIVPRNRIAEPVQAVEEKSGKKGVKNFGLLSFGEEAEEEEEELESVSKDLKVKKSAHDIGDPLLVSKKAIVEEEMAKTAKELSQEKEKPKEENKKCVNIDDIKSKLKKKDEKVEKHSIQSSEINEKEQKKKVTQEEIKKLEKELLEKKKKSAEEKNVKQEQLKEKETETEVFKQYKEDVRKYEHLKKKKLKSGKEDKTIELLKAFKERMFKAKQENKDSENEELNGEESGYKEPEKAEVETILTHRLDVDEEIKRKVIDANIADHERYDIYDPRNPLNKRKRDESIELIKQKKKNK